MNINQCDDANLAAVAEDAYFGALEQGVSFERAEDAQRDAEQQFLFQHGENRP